MDRVLVLFIRVFVAVLQILPLTWVAWFGRRFGGFAYWIDARHRKVAIKNLTACFEKEMSAAEIKALARENFRRIGESYFSALKTFVMTTKQLEPHLEIGGGEKVLAFRDGKPTSRIFAVGHFGNFELFASVVRLAPQYRAATTYRGLKGEAFNKLLLEMREISGCMFFERRTEGGALRAALRGDLLLLGLLSDQHAEGVRVPFFGRDCSTTKAPAVYALRYDLPLHTAICYRTRLAHWRIEVGDEIPTQENGVARSAEAIMLDVNKAFEVAVRRDPANWFWVHKRWKPAKVNAVPEQIPAG